MNRILVLSLLLGLMVVPMVAQKAIINVNNIPLLVDPVARTSTLLIGSPGGVTRGHTIGGDGAL